jgi:hypothetical protein
MKKIYLDDIRTPISDNWIVVRNYEDFVKVVTEIGLDKVELISLDHDLGETAMKEYFNNVSPNYKLDYKKIKEKTGYDCAKYLVDYYYETNPDRINMERAEKKKTNIGFPTVCVHSANPIGSANIMGYINNFLMNEGQPQNCLRVKIPHTTND